MSVEVSARYFDGRTAAVQMVRLRREAAAWQVVGNGWGLTWPADEARLSERLGNTPRLLRHRAGAFCQIDDMAALDQCLAQAGHPVRWQERLWHQWRWAVGAVVGVVLSMVFAYVYLLPWGARQVAMALPGEALQRISRYSLDSLDRTVLSPSQGDVARQAALTRAFAAQVFPEAHPLSYRIVFRQSRGLGANAFALPDGTLVVLDGLLALSPDDREILAVLAHEKGHVQGRHALRSALQSTVVGLAVAWVTGDAGTLVTTLPAMVMEARYSRAMEQEADDYARQVLQRNGDSPCRLASILKRLESQSRGGDASPGAFSTHPDTGERIKTLCPA